MNCKKAHQQIHLFAELTNEEQKQVLHHIAECEQCKELAQSMKLLNNVISRISRVQAEPSNSFQLTNKIMLEINKQGKQPFNLLEWFLAYIDLRPVKLVMAGVSVILFSLFAIEQTRAPQNIKQYSYDSDVGSSILNAKDFHDQLNNYKAKQKAKKTKACKKMFSNPQLTIACLREKNAHFKTL